MGGRKKPFSQTPVPTINTRIVVISLMLGLTSQTHLHLYQLSFYYPHPSIHPVRLKSPWLSLLLLSIYRHCPSILILCLYSPGPPLRPQQDELRDALEGEDGFAVGIKICTIPGSNKMADYDPYFHPDRIRIVAACPCQLKPISLPERRKINISPVSTGVCVNFQVTVSQWQSFSG